MLKRIKNGFGFLGVPSLRCALHHRHCAALHSGFCSLRRRPSSPRPPNAKRTIRLGHLYVRCRCCGDSVILISATDRIADPVDCCVDHTNIHSAGIGKTTPSVPQWRERIPLIVVIVYRNPKLFEIVRTRGTSCRFTSGLDDRKQEGDQNTDDRNDNKKLNERKSKKITIPASP